jgi:2-iminoacetate synthase ThiH
VDWLLYGPKLAQVALTFGADDFDGVPAETGSVNLLGPRRTTLEDVRRNIRAAALTPVARNARFEAMG